MKPNNIKIVFFGTPDFAVESLRRLLGEGYDVRAVVTMPDKTGGRGNRIIESAVKKFAVEAGLPVLQPQKLSDPAFVESLRALDADLFIVIAFRMLPRVVWTMPPLGTFNLHGSLLPQYRGAAPINHAIINGEKRTGVTTFLLKHEIDTGDILGQESIEIGPDEDFGTVYDRLMHIGADLTVRTVADIAAGTINPMPQDTLDTTELKGAPKIFHDDCRVDWRKDASAVHNLVRGLSPLPGAWCEFSLGGAQGAALSSLKVLRTRLAGPEAPALQPGELVQTGRKVLCGCGCGAVELITVQPSGKKAMDASAWYNGLRAGTDGRCPWLL